jgi:hypothetical protein
MIKSYKGYAYFDNNPNIVKIFQDLEAYQDFCRFELRNFDPADLYKRDNENWKAYQYSKRPKRPWNGKPRGNWNKNEKFVSR